MLILSVWLCFYIVTNITIIIIVVIIILLFIVFIIVNATTVFIIIIIIIYYYYYYFVIKSPLRCFKNALTSDSYPLSEMFKDPPKDKSCS